MRSDSIEIIQVNVQLNYNKMAIIVTYDVPSKHIELKKALFALNYQDRIPHKDSNGILRNIFLPNTTLYHASKNAEQARKDVQNICSALNIKLERCVATQWGLDWSAIWGEPFAS